jgi:hypothetical protein
VIKLIWKITKIFSFVEIEPEEIDQHEEPEKIITNPPDDVVKSDFPKIKDGFVTSKIKGKF